LYINAEIVLRGDLALFRCLAIPLDGFGVVLRHTATVGVHLAESSLRLGISLFSRLPLFFLRQPLPISAASMPMSATPIASLAMTKLSAVSSGSHSSSHSPFLISILVLFELVHLIT